TGLQSGLFAAVLVLLLATCCLTPWEVGWELALTAWCIGCCAINTLLLGARMPVTGDLWIALISAVSMSLASSHLWERRRRKLAQSEDQLRAEINRREAAQRTLLQNEETLRKALDANLDSVEITRLSDQRYIYVNEAFLKRGYAREQVLGKSVSELSLRESNEDLATLLSTLSAQGFVRNMEVGVRTRDGA